MVLAVALVGVVAVAEETIFRGYLLLRFVAVLRSPVLALLLSSAIFAVGHGYEGSAGLMTVGMMVFARVYLWRGSLIAPVVMHFLQDFAASCSCHSWKRSNRNRQAADSCAIG